MTTRLEHDLLGDRPVPADVYYGVQTARALDNFRITGLQIHPAMVKALGQIKKAAALANRDVGDLPPEICDAICQAADEVSEGRLADQFLVDPIQGGAGTSANMNANEVIANRAIELLGGSLGNYKLVSPNNHVNMAQSTNDVFPTAIRLAAMNRLDDLQEALIRLEDALFQKAAELDHVIKVGRTHLQDAVPIRMGQEFAAYGCAVQRSRTRIQEAARALEDVNMGATAVGTGLNADPAYTHAVLRWLCTVTGRRLRRVNNMVDGTQSCDTFVAVSGSLRAAAVALSKMANDLRLMASGPMAGLKEINLPEMQPGSSIMPGKVNPVMAEVLNQVCFQVIGCDTVVTLAAEAGQLELNVMEPVLAHNLLFAIDCMTNGVNLFTERCMRGITANRERCEQMVGVCAGVVTALNPLIGYENSSAIAREAVATGRTIRALVLERGLLDEETLDRVLAIRTLTEPGVARR